MNEPVVACPRCGARWPTGRFGLCAACLLAGDSVPPRLGASLELGPAIGRGGMGTVYRARHIRLDREVAVKFLPEDLAALPEFRARFEREARALAMLSHPHIVTLHDYGQEEEQVYLVMEHMPGGTLADRLPLAVADALEIGIQVCEALAYAHRQGVVHRDIKPENILFDAEGRAKVSDFGIARMVRGEREQGLPALTASGVAVGTPHYMAPEALQGGAPDPRMDVYSLGVVLYQMVTGCLPVGDFARAPGGLDPLIRRALAPDPARRVPGASEFLAALAGLRPKSGTPPTRVVETGAPDPGPAPSCADADEPDPAASRTGPGSSAAAEPSAGGGAGEPDGVDALWRRAAAAVCTLATAVSLWALVACLTPRILPADGVAPLVMVGAERLPDGRLVSRARFEVGPILIALAAWGGAAAAVALLRRHWHRGGLDRPEPGRPLEQSSRLFQWGGLCTILYLARKGGEALGFTAASVYIPLVGGVLELGVLLWFWNALLEAWRIRRPLEREPRLWAGLALALFPPVVEFAQFLSAWTP